MGSPAPAGEAEGLTEDETAELYVVTSDIHSEIPGTQWTDAAQDATATGAA
ncbi:hypothetical protein A2U01_0052377, partial [Trifolium medium]|nr:hypothetical protein [Trifolium medium]